MTGFWSRLCFLVDESEEAGLRLIRLSWKCLFRASFVQPEHPEPREHATVATDGDRPKINVRLICTASAAYGNRRWSRFSSNLGGQTPSVSLAVPLGG